MLIAWYEGCSGRDVGNLPVIWRVSKQAKLFLINFLFIRQNIFILIYYLWEKCMEEYLMETPSIVYMNLLSIYCSGSNNQSED